GGLDNTGIIWYSRYIMATKNSKSQQLRNADEALWRQIKAAAALEGNTLTEWVEKVAREKLNLKPE
ncbi:unnamed protein product, partial [marine sediment metagenome]